MLFLKRPPFIDLTSSPPSSVLSTAVSLECSCVGIGVSAKVIEHITDDAYNRQGEFRGKKAENQLEKRGKSKATPTNVR